MTTRQEDVRSGELDLLFLGRLIPPECSEEVRGKTRVGLEEASTALQLQLIRGLAEQGGRPVRVLNILPVGSYPRRYRDWRIPQSQFGSGEEIVGRSLPYLNVAGLKQVLRPRLASAHVAAWAREPSRGRKVMIAYTPDVAFLQAVRRAKRVNPAIVTCLVLPDLPRHLNLAQDSGPLLRAYKRMLAKYTEARMGLFDGYVLLTRQMAHLLEPWQPWMVMEGIATDAFEQVRPIATRPEKVIFYAGTLHERFGIIDLVDAFMSIPAQQYRLVLCGAGDAVPYIEAARRRDARIHYMGRLARSEVLRLEAEATITVNPRRNDGAYVRYSFPSKNMEYLSSGRPLVAYKLDGIPDEYDDHIEYVRADTVQALADRLVDMCNRDEDVLNEIGAAAREFVLRTKGRGHQSKRVLSFIRALA